MIPAVPRPCHTRTNYYVFNYPNSPGKILQYQQDLAERHRRNAIEQQTYTMEWAIQPTQTTVAGYNAVNHISDALTFWVKNSSSHCSTCNIIQCYNIQPTFLNKTKPKGKQPCICTKNRYVVPLYTLIPEQIRGLSVTEVKVLRPFQLDCGVYERQEHGYRVKNGMMRLDISQVSVLEKIQAMTDQASRAKCLKAYEFLLNSTDSSYRAFVILREELLANNTSLNVFNLSKTVGIECALWPNLYPFTEWCESSISGTTSRDRKSVV